MPTYITLFRFTNHGLTNIKDSPARVEDARQVFLSMGGEVKAFYAVMGQYDTVFIAEAPDDETVTKAVLAIGAAGNVHTETLRAFTEEEFRHIVATLP
jgi:uncharacterized protein with GYD domain